MSKYINEKLMCTVMMSVITLIMMISLGFDHRLIDGAQGAKFIQSIRKNLEKIDLFTRNRLESVMKSTENNTGMQLNLAISYGARQEIIKAVNKLIQDSHKNISETIFSNYLYTSGIPDPDLLIRTSGESRISNFLLWQIAYTEIYFVNKLWPDFNIMDYKKIINNFKNVKRNFGNI